MEIEFLRVANANMLADMYVQESNEDNQYYKTPQFSNKKLNSWPHPDTYDPKFVYHSRQQSDLDIVVRMKRLAHALCSNGIPHIVCLVECQATTERGQPGDQFGELLNHMEAKSGVRMHHTNLRPYSEHQHVPTGLMIVYDDRVVELLNEEIPLQATLKATFRLRSDCNKIFHVICHHNNPMKYQGKNQWYDLVQHLANQENPLPYILMGDFNRDNHEIRNNYIQEGIERLQLQDFLQPNVPTYAPLVGPLKRFDYLLCSKEFDIMEGWIMLPDNFTTSNGWKARNSLIITNGTDHAPMGVTCNLKV